MRTSKRVAGAIAAIVTATLALSTVIVPVGASGRPQPVRIDETTYFDSYPFTGPFSSTGGLICRYGTAQNGPESFDFLDPGSERDIHIAVVTTFTCADDRGSPKDEGGTFRIGRQIFIDLDARTEAFSWVVEGGGTGAYKELRGGGAGVTDFLPDPNHISHFQGFLSN
jgi:hypothetical protein